MANLEVNFQILKQLENKDKKRKNPNGTWFLFFDYLGKYSILGSDEDYYMLKGFLWGLYSSGFISEEQRVLAVKELINYCSVLNAKKI